LKLQHAQFQLITLGHTLQHNHPEYNLLSQVVKSTKIMLSPSKQSRRVLGDMSVNTPIASTSPLPTKGLHNEAGGRLLGIDIQAPDESPASKKRKIQIVNDQDAGVESTIRPQLSQSRASPFEDDRNADVIHIDLVEVGWSRGSVREIVRENIARYKRAGRPVAGVVMVHGPQQGSEVILADMTPGDEVLRIGKMVNAGDARAKIDLAKRTGRPITGMQLEPDFYDEAEGDVDAASPTPTELLDSSEELSQSVTTTFNNSMHDAKRAKLTSSSSQSPVAISVSFCKQL
jgi:hypothetical protein